MARIRTIKPEFWTDGAVMDMSPLARLLFIGTWSFSVCDYGHLPDEPRRLKAQVLPNDDCDPEALLDEIIRAGRIERLTLEDGRRYLRVVRFVEHQKIDRRWTPRCPVCRQFGSEKAALNLSQPPPTSPNLPQPQPRTGQDRTSRG